MLPNELRDSLIDRAIGVWHKAHAPYSGYSVGAALLADSGAVYEGVNIENAVYPLTICAERVAVFKAVSEGERVFRAIAVVTKNGGTPCGSCRQVLAEFGSDTLVLIADVNGTHLGTYTVAELLPDAFGEADIQ